MVSHWKLPVILVALSDRRPREAVTTVLRHFCYLLVPLCILLNKYFPELSKQYDPFSGVATYAGATTSKNMLGVASDQRNVLFLGHGYAMVQAQGEGNQKNSSCECDFSCNDDLAARSS